jgi:hypothetical protein
MMTPDEQKEFLRTLGEVMRESIRDAIAPLEKRIAQLEESGIRYCGVFQRALAYRRGDTVTFDSNLWVCLTDTSPNETPGASTRWQLAVRCGADGINRHRAPTASRSQRP